MQTTASGLAQRRLIQALVAFPLAALIGFGASVAVRTLVANRPSPPAPSAPGPSGADSWRPSPERQPRPVRSVPRAHLA